MSNHDNNSIRKNGWWSTCTKSFTAARWNTGKTDRTAATKQYDKQQTLRFIKIIEDLLNENTILKSRLAIMENTSLLKLNTKKLNEQLINTEHHPGFPLVEEIEGIPPLHQKLACHSHVLHLPPSPHPHTQCFAQKCWFCNFQVVFRHFTQIIPHVNPIQETLSSV